MSRDARFDHYLDRLAAGLRKAGVACRAVVPDVDGGLIFALDAGRERVAVNCTFEAVQGRERRAKFKSERLGPQAVQDLERAYLAHTGEQSHRLLGFEGQDMDEILVRPGASLQRVWSRHLKVGRDCWRGHRLEALRQHNGALHLEFEAPAGRVELRITDGQDPRLARADKILRVGRLALSLMDDQRAPDGMPADPPVERFIAYLLAHTTGPRTRIRGRAETAPSALLFGRQVQLNAFVPEGRQGASGMAAALFGRPRRRLRIVSLGDASCRQTFPALSATPLFDTWSYFPVKTAPPLGAYAAVDFDERTLVGGAEERLRRVIEDLKAEVSDLRVALIQTCLSRLIGDDVEGVLREALGPGRYVVLDPDFQARDEAVDARVWSWALDAFRPDGKDKQAASGRGPAVNLVGLGQREAPATAELIGLLKRLGVRVNASLFPSFEEDELLDFDQAKLTVASTCQLVQRAFGRAATLGRGGRWLALQPPFGLKHTRAWARAVLERLRRGQARKRAEDLLDEEVGRTSRALGPLRRELAGVRLAAVAAGRFAAYLFQPAELFGIPLIDCLSELGVGTDLFVLSDGAPMRELEGLARRRKRVELHTFDQPDRLLEAVAASQARLLLTSVRRNEQARDLGKVPVFAPAFEMGLPGAIRTAERLALAARLAFPRAGTRTARP